MTTRVGLVQLCATPDVAANLAVTEALTTRAAGRGAELILLPEAFAFVGSPGGRLEIAEPLPKGGTP